MSQENDPVPVPLPEVEIAVDPKGSAAIIKLEAHSGPLPSPASFAAYEQVLPGAADRILTMAEKSQKALHLSLLAGIAIDFFTKLVGAVIVVGVFYLTFKIILLNRDPKAYAALLLEFIALAKLYVDSRKHDGK